MSMQRPAHLTETNAGRFKSRSVVDHYHLRLPYPDETYEILANLMSESLQIVLDVGTGTGPIARHLVEFVDRVDALDYSAAMVERGKSMPNGDHPRLNWIIGPAETAPLNPPYSLIIAGDSLHWMDWDVVFARFAQALSQEGYVVITGRNEVNLPWQAELVELIPRYSLIRNFERFNLADELQKRDLFELVGSQLTQPESNLQSVEDYIGSWHSRSSFPLDVMKPEDALAFDNALREMVASYASDGMLELSTQADLTWGRPKGQ